MRVHAERLIFLKIGQNWTLTQRQCREACRPEACESCDTKELRPHAALWPWLPSSRNGEHAASEDSLKPMSWPMNQEESQDNKAILTRN